MSNDTPQGKWQFEQGQLWRFRDGGLLRIEAVNGNTVEYVMQRADGSWPEFPIMLHKHHLIESLTNGGAVLLEPLAGRIAALESQLAAARHDISAYRGALGYSIAGSHDSRLTDGTMPVNGIAVAMGEEISRLTARLAQVEAERDEISRFIDAEVGIDENSQAIKPPLPVRIRNYIESLHERRREALRVARQKARDAGG